MRKFIDVWILTWAVVLVAALIVLLAGCVQQPQPQSPPPSVNVQVDIPRPAPPCCPSGKCFPLPPVVVPQPVIVAPPQPSLHFDLRIPIGPSHRPDHREHRR